MKPSSPLVLRPSLSVSCLAVFLAAQSAPAVFGAALQKPPGAPVSYYEEVRPILQANCQGCHQPSKAKGGYVMTSFSKLLAGGEKDGVAIVPGDHKKGSLIEQITPVNGEAEMPKGKPPLAEHEVELIRRWIAEGATDDTPADAKQHFDAEHPPLYPRLPVISSLDYSPDGQWLAVAGFHEVLLHKSDGSGIAARLIGLSERIQSLRFSPDGRWLAAVGGDPARLGEVQIWEVASGKLKVSAPTGWDTLYGVSWSPDSKFVAFGCADNTVRAIEAESGKQIFQMGSHNDWVLETAFSGKGDHLVSVGRDMTAKLSEVAGGRFVDNITSITPGALRGGIHALDRHPGHEVILVGGSDGIPQLFRIFRTTARKIGDNANLIQKYPEMTGRIFSTRFSKDGLKFAVGSALDGKGEVSVFGTAKTMETPADIAAIRSKDARKHTPEEAAKLKEFEENGGTRISQAKLESAAVYTVAFHPSGDAVAAAGSDGQIRIFDAATGQKTAEFPAAPVTPNATLKTARKSGLNAQPNGEKKDVPQEILPEGRTVAGIEVVPAQIQLNRRNDAVQLLVSAKFEGGEVADITRVAKIALSAPVASLSPRGQVRPVADGAAQLQVTYQGKTLTVPVTVRGAAAPFESDFIRDVNPVMTKLGCNQGTCHGAKDGKAGFKLSLRGYDPEYDLRSLTDDMASRRVTTASPDDSLILLKAIAEVPHEGGRRMVTDDNYYQIIRQWIAAGSPLDMNSARVTRIELAPQNPVIQQVGSRQQVRVVAHYSDGTTRDVSNEAFVETGNADVASVDGTGLVSTLRRGEAPLLARYEGNYAATTVTVMGDRNGFEWQEPETWGPIDQLVAAKWKRMKVLPSDLCADNEFVRRVCLDLTGLPPSPDKLRAFLADPRESRVKREALVDELVGSVDFVEHWTNKWSDLLQVNAKFLGKEGAEGFRGWIRSALEKNMPYDQFVREIVTASGSNKDNPAASYWKTLRQPTEALENTTHLFLATRFNCNKCHDHPFERWTQDQYYQTAAYFAQFSLQEDPASNGRKLGGTAVEGAKPLFEIIKENPGGEMKHDRTGKVTAPQFPYPVKKALDTKAPRREQLATWMTAPDNRYFASSYVNRAWGYLLGRGIIEPLDDIRAGNPPTNPELLAHLTELFVGSGFDTRQVFRTICKSRTYQLSIKTHRWNEDDTVNFSHAVARRLSAETLFDAVFSVTGATPSLPGIGAGMRAAQMIDSSSEGAGAFLATLGKPSRESACECERSNELRLGSVMALLSGETVSTAIQSPKNQLAKLVQKETDDTRLVNELFLRVLSREATPAELEATQKLMKSVDTDHQSVEAAWQAKEKEQAPVIAKMEKDRVDAMAAAKGALEVYEAETKALREEREVVRKERETRAKTALDAWQNAAPARVEGWIATAQPANAAVQWTPLAPKTATASNPAVKLGIEKDGSVAATGPAVRADYTLGIPADVKGITGILLEVLPDPAAPLFGPGRSPDGNFILSELALRAAPASKPNQAKAVDFVKTWASLEQPKFPLAAAIDGIDSDPQNGWAIGSGGAGRRQVAAFQLKEPLSAEEAAHLELRLSQKSRDGAQLARIRISVTTASNPLMEGAPLPVAAAAAVARDQRTPEQTQTLAQHVMERDPEYWRLSRELAEAKKPLPPDARHVLLKDGLATASKPIVLDSSLVQLRVDAEASKKQTENKRLTVVQDLAWALINNPAFLFNR